MSKVKDVFYAWASNDSGASMDIPHSRGKLQDPRNRRIPPPDGERLDHPHYASVCRWRRTKHDGAGTGRGPKIPNPITTPAGGPQPRLYTNQTGADSRPTSTEENRQ